MTKPQGKARVYFTCHSKDFERCFNKVCTDILDAYDCAIYYKENMDQALTDEEKNFDLNCMNLFVVPVTLRLLTEWNYAMDDDISYAKKKNIPILPIMMDSGIDGYYGRPDKFGELQYLNPYSYD